MKVYGLPEGQGLNRRNDMARAAGKTAFCAFRAIFRCGHCYTIIYHLDIGYDVISTRECQY